MDCSFQVLHLYWYLEIATVKAKVKLWRWDHKHHIQQKDQLLIIFQVVKRFHWAWAVLQMLLFLKAVTVITEMIDLIA